MIPIRVIEHRGAAALVEWQTGDGAQRAYVPVTEITENAISEQVALQGITYGMPWELLPLGVAGPELVAAELRRRGIWTAADVRQNVAAVRAALSSVYAQDLKIILDATRE